MHLFDRDRIYSVGMSIAELTIVGFLAALLWILSSYVTAVVSSHSGTEAAFGWPTIRAALGTFVGVPLLGIAASKGLGLGLLGQLAATTLVVAGGGPLLALVIQQMIVRLLHS